MSWNITWQCLTACVFAFTTFCTHSSGVWKETLPRCLINVRLNVQCWPSTRLFLAPVLVADASMKLVYELTFLID